MFLSTPPVWVATTGGHDGRADNLTFLSTPPVWVATAQMQAGEFVTRVSIHATRVGGDV